MRLLPPDAWGQSPAFQAHNVPASRINSSLPPAQEQSRRARIRSRPRSHPAGSLDAPDLRGRPNWRGGKNRRNRLLLLQRSDGQLLSDALRVHVRPLDALELPDHDPGAVVVVADELDGVADVVLGVAVWQLALGVLELGVEEACWRLGQAGAGAALRVEVVDSRAVILDVGRSTLSAGGGR